MKTVKLWMTMLVCAMSMEMMAETEDSARIMYSYLGEVNNLIDEGDYIKAKDAAQRGISYIDDFAKYELNDEVHEIYLQLGEINKHIGTPKEVRDALFTSFSSNMYYIYTFRDFNQVMKDIELHWLEDADDAYKRYFYEFYFLYYNHNQGSFEDYKQLVQKLEEYYSPKDSLLTTFVELCLFQYDSTYTPMQKLDRGIQVIKKTDWHPMVSFADYQDLFSMNYFYWFFNCNIWDCDNDTIALKMDTIYYWQNKAYYSCLRQRDMIYVDSIRLADGDHSEKYREAILWFISKHYLMDGCGMVADCFKQMLTWSYITPEDVLWMEENAKITNPLTFSKRRDDSFYENEGGVEWTYWCSDDEYLEQLYQQVNERTKF